MDELPLEIWFIVFQYLEAHDIFEAFWDLNSHFNRILNSNQLSFFVRLKGTDNNHFKIPPNPYWSDSVLKRITCLRPVLKSQSNYFSLFLYFHSDKLIRLQSLSVKASYRDSVENRYFSQSLNKLVCLECLSYTGEIDDTILSAILALPKLRICQLILGGVETSSGGFHRADVNSPIKQLFFVFLNSIDYQLVNLLLCHTPDLKRLEISGRDFSFSAVSLFSQTLFTLPKLRVLKLKLDSGFLMPDCFQYLHETFPALKYFYFNYTKHLLSGTFFDDFITNWWSIIKPIQRFEIYIKGHILIKDTSVQSSYQKFRQLLSEKINQSNAHLKLEWNEQVINLLRLIEINIVKN